MLLFVSRRLFGVEFLHMLATAAQCTHHRHDVVARVGGGGRRTSMMFRSVCVQGPCLSCAVWCSVCTCR